jgi:hypothetical protein
LSLDAVEELEGGHKSLEEFRRARGWLDDPRRYDDVPVLSAKGAPATRMKDEWIDQLVEGGVVVPIKRSEVRGWTKMFVVPEPAKRRFRPIKHTYVANEVIGKETLQKITFPSKAEICDLVHKGDCFIALDFAAYYDQFLLHPDVAHRFCFRKGNRFFRLNTLPMGIRNAVECASCTTARILDFSRASATEAIIDNVIFVGKTDEVIHDATIFDERRAAVGAKLNEDTSDIAALVQNVGDWGGIHLDFVNKTTSLTQKTLEKTAFSWGNRDIWTNRQFAAHIGLLFWSVGIINVPMAEFFPLLRFISSLSRVLTEREDLWEQRTLIPPSVWPSLDAWTALVLRNKPRDVPRSAAPEWLLITDASEFGWGYYAINNVTGAVRSHGAQWSYKFRELYGARLRESTFTEPQGIHNACCHLLDPTNPTRVRILTDSTVAQASFSRGYNTHSYHINECVRRLKATFGDDFVFDYVHIPGVCNLADEASRGVIARDEETRDHMSSQLRRLAGSAQCPRALGLASLAGPAKSVDVSAHDVDLSSDTDGEVNG